MNAGDKAPDFTLTDQDGKPFRLRDNLGRAGTVIFFYPKDNSPICTSEVCSFRERQDVLTDMGVTVVGISSDDQASHRGFAADNNLSYRLVSDPGGKVAKLYGARKLGLIPLRVTYVLDPFGIVVGKYNDMLNAEPHVLQAIRMLGTIEN